MLDESRRLCKCSPLHHLHVDFLDINFLVELGRKLRLSKQLLVDGGRHGVVFARSGTQQGRGRVLENCRNSRSAALKGGFAEE